MSYADGDNYVFMNNETYDQMELSKDTLGDNAKYLKEGLEIQIAQYEGEIIGIDLPEKIDYEVFILCTRKAFLDSIHEKLLYN